MSRTNKPIWQDTIVTETGVSLQHLVNDAWQDTGMRIMPVPAGYEPEAAINRFVEDDLKSTKPEFVGETAITVQPYAYQVYKFSGETSEYGFLNDWSYEEWTGDTRCLSAPINKHADSRQRLVYGNFSETGNSIIVKELIRPVITITPRIINVGAEQTTAYIEITSNIPYELSTDSNWFTISPTSGSAGNQMIYVSTSENQDFSDRQALITLTHESYWDIGTETITACTITQRAIVPSYNVSPLEQGITWDTSDLVNFVVNTNVPFTASTNASWLTYSGQSQAEYHSYNVYFSASNNSGDTREATVFFQFQVDATGGTQTITPVVRQNREPIIELDYNDITITGITHYQVRLYSDTYWNMTSSESWMTVSPISGNSGYTDIEISCDFSTSRRVGNVIFENSIGKQAILQVTQIPYIAANEMWYTSSNGQIINLDSASDPWNVNLVSNTYSDGYGKMVFDGNLTEIPKKAFYNRSNFRTIWLPTNIQKIGQEAFPNQNYNTFNVYYMGTYNDWQNVILGNNAFYTGKTAFHFITASYTEVPYVKGVDYYKPLIFGVNWTRSFPNSNYLTKIVVDFVFTGSTYDDYTTGTSFNIIKGNGSEVYQRTNSSSVLFKTTRYLVRAKTNTGNFDDYVQGDIGVIVTGHTHNSLTIEEKKVTNNSSRQNITSGWSQTMMVTTANSLNICENDIAYKSIKVIYPDTTALDCIAVTDENGTPGFYDRITKTFMTVNGCSVFNP